MDTYFHSVRLDKEKCKGCTNCIKRCPTQAIRVRDGKAHIIKERCIDCGECIRVCPHHAKYASRDSLSQIVDYKYRIALPAPALYGQFNNLKDATPILKALPLLGFDAVFEVATAAELISDATKKLMKTTTLKKPIISSACPAIVRLIRVCFPDLLDNILPINPPVEEAARIAREFAVKKTGLRPHEIGIFFISPCPAKMTAIKNPLGLEKSNLDGAVGINDIYPVILKIMEKSEKYNMPETEQKSGLIGMSWATSGGEALGTGNDNSLSADGIENCMKILEEIETGTLDSVDFIELNACQGGCVGGVLTAENPYIAKSRLTKLGKLAPDYKNTIEIDGVPEEFLHKIKIEPANDVMKLADNVAEAMLRMKRMNELLDVFPGLDCGTCGTPSCRALAEDIVRGFANEDDCVFRMKQNIEQMKHGDEFTSLIPAPFRQISNQNEKE